MNNIEFKANYHTHTERCHHAVGSDEDYVTAAIKAGYTLLGFSEHSPWNYSSNYKPSMRLLLEDFDEYKSSILELRERYKSEINIRLGLECEYFPEYMNWLKEFKEEKEIDYLIFGNHFNNSDETGQYYGNVNMTDDMIREYVKSSIAGIEFGIFSYFAHPDLFMRSHKSFDALALDASREICRAAKAFNMPLEYNLCGMRYDIEMGVEGYPCSDFWRVAAEEGCSAIIGVDAHNPAYLLDNSYTKKAKAIIKKLDMPLVENLWV